MLKVYEWKKDPITIEMFFCSTTLSCQHEAGIANTKECDIPLAKKHPRPFHIDAFRLPQNDTKLRYY